MSLEEVADLLQLSPVTIQRQFQRTRENLLKKQGIQLVKIGRGESAEYYVKVDGELVD